MTPLVSARTRSRPSGFSTLGVPDLLVDALAEHGVDEPFPIQAATLPDALAGHDVLGRGRTGSGKTYAFLLPVLARLAADGAARRERRPRALVLLPTRELAAQVHEAAAPLAEALGLRTLTVFGGVAPQPQINGLRRGVDLLIACPGRLGDHLRAGHARLDAVEITVLDEADHMADLGFLPVVRRLLDATPSGGQRLLFSATLDADVQVLVREYLVDPVTHSVDSAQSPVDTMTHHVLRLRHEDRLAVLAELTAAAGRTLVFARTRRGASRLATRLAKAGVPAVELHGDLSQTARTRNLAAFSSGTATTLVATDIAARGIHVDGVGLVVHADPPAEHKAYLHRSGRTARAGARGVVVTLATQSQLSTVKSLMTTAGITADTTEVAPGHPLLHTLTADQPPAPAAQNTSTPNETRRTTDTRPQDKPTTGKPATGTRASGKPAKGKPTKAKPANGKRTADSRTADSRPADKRTAENSGTGKSRTERPDGQRQQQNRRDDTRRDRPQRDENQRDARRDNARKADPRKADARKTGARKEDTRKADVRGTGAPKPDERQGAARRPGTERRDTDRRDNRTTGAPARGNRDRDETPRNAQSRNGRRGDGRPNGTQSRNTQSRGTQPRGTQSRGARPQGDRPSGSQPPASHPRGDRPHGERRRRDQRDTHDQWDTQRPGRESPATAHDRPSRSGAGPRHGAPRATGQRDHTPRRPAPSRRKA